MKQEVNINGHHKWTAGENSCHCLRKPDYTQ